MPRPTSSRPTPDQRAAFYVALEQTRSARKASIAAGVSRETGRAWAKQAKVAKAEHLARSVLIATKQDIACELTRIGLYDPEVAPRDKVNALATASKVLGYDAPTVTRHEVIIGTYDQYLELLERRERIAAGGEVKQVGGGEPPIQVAAESFSSPQVTPKNSETGDK